jgi:uncharacterized damage-inducible protein DinB
VPTPPRDLPLFEGPDDDVTDALELLLGYLDWYRAAVLRKIDGLSESQLRTPVDGVGWSPLGLVQHLGHVERRWMQWGFRGEPMDAFPLGDAEWEASTPTAQVLATYAEQVEKSRAAVAGHALDTRAETGGAFAPERPAPSLGRILFHLLQEYSRHAGHLDVARQLIDGTVGE